MSLKQTVLNPLKKLIDAVLVDGLPEKPAHVDPAEALSALGHFIIPATPEPDPGYVILRDGRQKPISELTDFERRREEKLQVLAADGIDLYLRLADWAARFDDDFDEMDAESGPRVAKNARESGKQSVSRALIDGSVKLERKRADMVGYDDDKMLAAKEIVDQCIKRFSGGEEDTELAQIAKIAFTKNDLGQYSRQGMMTLLRVQSQDAEWLDAMALIKKAEKKDGVAAYKLISIRDKYGKWHPLPLNIAAVRPCRRPAHVA
ncbi:MAG: DUF3164 family protein [Candidatus Methylumidiphilus sp.]